ncbi:MAG TPA: hypothetical protein VM869_13335 [Enhygromyxa sp.]|nr:hypothetical protein [Enhygromyxa sp.]
MSGMIYGVFDTRAQAERAIEAVEEQVGHDGLNALVHEGQMRDEDVQMGGTDALKGAVKGALVVGCVAALIGGVLLIPGTNMSVGWTEFLFMAIGGTIMGVTAGAVAGASEPRKELVAMARRLEEGKVLVTMANDEIPTATIVELFEKAGAVEARAA